MEMNALVSVVIPCYRCSETIERAVASVWQQTIRPAEVMLVEDASGDGTLDTLRKIQRAYPSGWVAVIPMERNVGPGEARNAGWNAASGDYIAFLDADDSWHPRKIEIQLAWMQSHPHAALSGHEFRQLDDERADSLEDEHLPVVDVDFHPIDKKPLLLANRFSTPTVMLRRSIPHRFLEGCRYCEDYRLWLEIACDGFECYRSELPLAYLHKAPYGEMGLSASLWKMEKGELAAYRAIYERGHLGRAAFALLGAWSLARFARRVMVVATQRSRKGRR